MENKRREREDLVSIYGFMPSIPSCVFNGGVECDEQDIPNKCKRCGWNPVEAERRRAESRAKYGDMVLTKEAIKKAEEIKAREDEKGADGVKWVHNLVEENKDESVLQEGTRG